MLSTQSPRKQETKNPFEEPVNIESAPVSEEKITLSQETVTSVAEASAPDDDVIYGWELEQLLLQDQKLNNVPDPPKCIMDDLKSRDLKWRWMSKPFVKTHGLRQYTTYSPSAEQRKKIKNGDAPPAVDVDVENKVTWREDSFLATIPRRQFMIRRILAKQRVQNQNDLAKSNILALKEKARSAGVKLNADVTEGKSNWVYNAKD